MRRSKTMIGLIVIIMVLICTNLYSAYIVVDQSITRFYSDAGIETTRHNYDHLIRVIAEDWNGLTKTEVLARLNAAAKGLPEGSFVVKDDDDGIWFDEVFFAFKDGRLERVE